MRPVLQGRPFATTLTEQKHIAPHVETQHDTTARLVYNFGMVNVRRTGQKEENLAEGEYFQKKRGKMPEFAIGGGYDGKNIYVSDRAHPAEALTHELGHAILKHDPSSVDGTMPVALNGAKYSIDPTKEKEANDVGAKIKRTLGPSGIHAMMEVANKMARATFRSRRPMLPYLTDGFGNKLSDEAIARLLNRFTYRHGNDETKALVQQIKNENEDKIRKVIPIKLHEFVNILKRADWKSTKKTGHLLELVLNEYQDEFQLARDEPSGKEAWDSFGTAARLIKDWSGRLNNPGVSADEETPLLAPDPEKFAVPQKHQSTLKVIKQEQWQAAAVTAMRAGWLTGIGFLELKRSLKEATEGTGNVIELRLDRAVIHEAGLQNESGRNGMKFGTFQRPQYAKSATELEETLNKALKTFESSGWYYERFGVILKALDLGHKLVDKWENHSHRVEGQQVDPKADFKFLALLSSHDNSQEVIGANGQVLGDGSYMFTIDTNFRFRYLPAANYVGEGGTAKNFVQFIPHAQLASQEQVAGAGNFTIKDGKFVWIDNGSGHYRVDASVNKKNTTATLQNLGYNLAGVRFLNRAKGDLDAIYKAGNEILSTLPSDVRPVMTPEIQAMQDAVKRIR
jgi:hypothetical protein